MTTPNDELLISLIKSMNAKNLSDPAARQQVLGSARQLVTALEDPFSKAFELIFGFSVLACARVAADLGVFPALQSGPKTLKQLADTASAEESFVVRILRPLVAWGILSQPDVRQYAATAVSNIFAIPSLTDGLKHNFDLGYRTCAKLPEYFREKGFHNPDQCFDGPFQYYFNTKTIYFDWLKDNPREATQFNNFMSGYGAGLPDWVDIFPSETLYADVECSRDDVLLVDVGGGFGHDLVAFKKKFPNHPGKLVLQDLPEVVDSIPENSIRGIEVIDYDFFKPQPVKAAGTYFLKHVLHDWPDREATMILKNVVNAMKKGFSRVIIVDAVMPETAVPLSIAGLDIMMMCATSSAERSETQWRTLMSGAGLEVANIWGDETDDAVIEGILK